MLLVGPAGAGKTTFAARHFMRSQAVSSDAFRALVAGDEADMTASADAFQVLYLVVDVRLRRGLLTVVDATNVQARHRRPLVTMAVAHRRPVVGIVFALPLDLCVERDRLRSGRSVGAAAIGRQWRSLQTSLPRLPGEGFDPLFVIDSAEDLDQAEVELSASGL